MEINFIFPKKFSLLFALYNLNLKVLFLSADQCFSTSQTDILFYKLRSPVKAILYVDIKIIIWFTMKYTYISNLV